MFENYDREFDAWMAKVAVIAGNDSDKLAIFFSEFESLGPHDYFDAGSTPEQFAAEVSRLKVSRLNLFSNRASVSEDKKAPVCLDCECGQQVDIRGDINLCLKCGVVYNIIGEPYAQVYV